MPSRKVVKGPVGILIFDDEFNHIRFVTEVISQTLGYHPTQAFQCANLIHEKGSYVVKSFPYKELHKAQLIRNILVNSGLAVKIIPL